MMGAAVSTLPKSGPIVFSIPGISGVSVAGNSQGSLITYRWPARYVLSSWILLPRSGLEADAGDLSVSMTDDMGQQLVSDGQGLATLSAFMPALASAGIGGPFSLKTNWDWSPQWQPLSRIVAAGDTWQFQIANSSGGAIVPFLGFRVEVPG